MGHRICNPFNGIHTASSHGDLRFNGSHISAALIGSIYQLGAFKKEGQIVALSAFCNGCKGLCNSSPDLRKDYVIIKGVGKRRSEGICKEKRQHACHKGHYRFKKSFFRPVYHAHCGYYQKNNIKYYTHFLPLWIKNLLLVCKISFRAVGSAHYKISRRRKDTDHLSIHSSREGLAVRK